MQQLMQQNLKVLEQKKKFLTFEELCKEWSVLISREGGYHSIMKNASYAWKNQPLEMGDNRYCVVGEANGFDNSYGNGLSGKYCEKCYNFSMQFYCGKTCDEMYGTPIYNDEDFEKVKTQFVDHFNNVHV